jgi:hypothetical protein
MHLLRHVTACVASALILAAVNGCKSESGAHAVAQRVNSSSAAAVTLPAGVIRWAVDNVQSIGGQVPTVLGAPKVVDDGSGKAVSFNGTSDGLILPVVPLAGMKAFTLEVLFRPESGGATEQRFMHSEDDAMRRMTVETRLTADGKWSLDTFLLAGNSRLSLYDATKLHPADKWYWVALRYDGTTMSDFVNGAKELEGPVTFPAMGSNGRISLGVRLNMVNWFKGQIKEVRFTPRAVGEGELQRLP